MTRCKTIISILVLALLVAAFAIQPLLAKDARHIGTQKVKQVETIRKTDDANRPNDPLSEAEVNPNATVVPYREGLATGDNCTDPLKITLPAQLPYSDLAQTTCGRANDYSTTCLGSYDGGEDIVYEITVTASVNVLLKVDFKTSTWTGFAIGAACPLPASGCLGSVTSSSSGVKSIGPLTLAPGTYYVMMDTYPTPDCITAFDFTISEPPAPLTCAAPMVANISAGTLPLVLDNLYTCGRGNDYSTTCMDYYDGGEDMILQLNVTGPLFIDLTMDPKGTTYSAMAIDDVCPLDAAIGSCLGFVGTSTGTVKSITGLTLNTGTYYVMFDTWPSPACIPDFKLTITGGTPPPANNDCVNATPIGDVSGLVWNTSAASHDGAGTCIGASSPNIWYCFTAPFGGNTTFSLCGSSFDTKLAIYDGCSCAPLGAVLACADDDCGTASEVTLPVLAGHQYTIEVGGYSTYSGAGVLNVTTAIAPPNDDCSDVTPVTLTAGVPVTFTGDNTGASADCAGFSGNNAWEGFTLTECSDVTLDYCGTTPAFGNAWLNLSQGCPCTSFTPAGVFDVTTCPDGNVTITWAALPAGTYYYPVLTEAGAVGPYTINVVASTVSSYCAADGYCDEYISNVKLGTINNSSSCSSSYGDYTAISTNLTQYIGYTLTVTNGSAYTYDACGVWIDWDHDNCFSASEAATVSGGPAVFTATVTPPASALMGPTRMRIRILYDALPTSCGTAEYGEVEDYTVNVIPLVPTATIAPNPQYMYYMFAVTPVTDNVIFGNFAGGYTAANIDLSTVTLNGAPVTATILPSSPNFLGNAVQIQLPLSSFLPFYGLLYDVNNLTFNVAWTYTDATPGSITGNVTIIGKSSPVPSRYIIPEGSEVVFPGDFNIDGRLSVSDAVSLVGYIFSGATAPANPMIGDTNCSGRVTISDVVYLIQYIFNGGAAPCAVGN